MIKKITFTLLSLLLVLNTSCGSKDDDCTKMMAIPQLYVENNQIKTRDVMQEVSCDFPEPEDLKEPPQLKNFSYEVVYFTFIPDTGNKTSQLKFEIKLNNGNNYAIEGLPALTIRSEGLETTGVYSKDAAIPCYGIAANSSCTLTFDKEYPLDLDLGTPGARELVSVKYYIAD